MCKGERPKEQDKNRPIVKEDEIKRKNKNSPPEPPTTCCMSGCPNCVWLDYAEELIEYYKDGGEQAIKEINEKITDGNLKAFLLHELRMRKK